MRVLVTGHNGYIGCVLVPMFRDHGLYGWDHARARVFLILTGLTAAYGLIFGTDAAELMEIMAGEMTVLLPGEAEWRAISGGQSFEVVGNAKFKLKVATPVDYCCSYLA